MIRLKSRQQPGPNGWLFWEKRTGWKSHEHDPVSQWDFYLLCRRYREHALANPGLALPTDMKAIEDMIDFSNAARYARIPGAESYYVRTDAVPKSAALPLGNQGQGFLQSVVGRARNIEAGRRTLSDWWGEGGKPVAQEVADRRASICADCPQNDSGGLLAKFTIEAANHIQESIEEMNNQKLVTVADSKLRDHVCRACDCPLKLKVFTPLQHILKHMPEATRAKLDPNCWILAEAK